MRKIVITAASAALALGIAAPAFAQDVPVETTVTNAPFTGFRVEGLAGYDHVGGDAGRDGFAYGGAIGYDAQVGGVILGVDGEVMGSTVKGTDTNVLTAGDSYRLKAGRDLYVGARLGYAISPQALIYAKGGYTNARINERYSVGTATIRDHQNAEGYRVGAGIEYNLTPKTYVKGEYRYSHYSKLDNYNIDLDRHQVLGGVGYRF